jgi:adenosylhomocysteine nucleosidase
MIVSRLLLALSLFAPFSLSAKAGSNVVDPTPRIALLSAYQPEWDALRAIVDEPKPSRQSGVEVITGKVEGHPVVLVLSGASMINAALTAQMMIDRFELKAILSTGIAGGVDPGLNIGDVVVADRWGEYFEVILARATTDGFKLPAWAEKDQQFHRFGMIYPRSVEIVKMGSDEPVRQFWFPVDRSLFEVARHAVGHVPLKRCLGTAICIDHAPKVVIGGNGVSGTAFVDNDAFRDYTHRTFSAQAIDMQSAAVAHVAAINNVPFIAFRSVSDLAGGGPGENECSTFQHLAADNSVAVLRAFLKALPK